MIFLRHQGPSRLCGSRFGKLITGSGEKFRAARSYLLVENQERCDWLEAEKTNQMKTIKYHAVSLISGLLILFLSGCTTAPVTGRSQLNLVSSDQESQLGLTEFDKMKQQTPIDTNPADNALLQKVGKRIAVVASKDMPDAKWEFVMFQSREANAFCLPGGKVGVYSGILPITRDEAGLATVLGHEVAHAAAHHGNERMSQQMLMQSGGQIIGSQVSGASALTQTGVTAAYGLGSQVGIALPYNRKQESEADHIGLVYMARAGYDPQVALDFWQRFAQYSQQQGGSGGPAFLRDHPVDSVRIQQIRQWIPEAEAQLGQSRTQ
ncbi:MAG: Peptidase Ste24p [Pedosphaera sp.]|nr:Peptidase Ste24p [Pedosphaera sp.]